MIPKECKRLAEVDFPIAVVSKHAAREVDTPRPPLHASSLVGVAATGGVPVDADGVALARPRGPALPG